jgi:hypothetical protein
VMGITSSFISSFISSLFASLHYWRAFRFLENQNNISAPKLKATGQQTYPDLIYCINDERRATMTKTIEKTIGPTH